MSSDARRRIELQTEVLKLGGWQSCSNCDHGRFGPPCQLYKIDPPLPVQTVGCESWAPVLPF